MNHTIGQYELASCIHSRDEKEIRGILITFIMLFI